MGFDYSPRDSQAEAAAMGIQSIERSENMLAFVRRYFTAIINYLHTQIAKWNIRSISRAGDRKGPLLGSRYLSPVQGVHLRPSPYVNGIYRYKHLCIT